MFDASPGTLSILAILVGLSLVLGSRIAASRPLPLETVTHNLGLKAISFLIAATIWFKVSFTNPAGVTVTYERRLAIVNKDPSLSMSLPPGLTDVKLVVTGRRLDLLIAEPLLGAQVDLKNVRSPIGVVTVKVDPVLPPNLDLKATVEPPVVRIAVAAGAAGTGRRD